MSKLKDINLSDLGIKSKKMERLINSSESEMMSGNYLCSSPFSEKMSMKSEVLNDEPYYLKKMERERNINNSPKMNNKFLKYINIITNIKNKPGVYLDKRAE